MSALSAFSNTISSSKSDSLIQGNRHSHNATVSAQSLSSTQPEIGQLQLLVESATDRGSSDLPVLQFTFSTSRLSNLFSQTITLRTIISQLKDIPTALQR